MQAKFDPDDSEYYLTKSGLWVFDCRDGVSFHLNEQDAKWAQRTYRVEYGFCVHTGARL